MQGTFKVPCNWQNGLELIKMNGILLEKVEELTFYIIQLNKRIEKLEKQNQN